MRGYVSVLSSKDLISQVTDEFHDCNNSINIVYTFSSKLGKGIDHWHEFSFSVRKAVEFVSDLFEGVHLYHDWVVGFN